jgi:hypothetical protein
MQKKKNKNTDKIRMYAKKIHTKYPYQESKTHASKEKKTYKKYVQMNKMKVKNHTHMNTNKMPYKYLRICVQRLYLLLGRV